MHIVKINTNFSNQTNEIRNKNFKKCAPSFKGKIGKSIADSICNGEKIEIKEVMTKMSGMFGISKDGAKDVLEELLKLAENLRKDLVETNEKLRKSNNKIMEEPSRIRDAVRNAQEEIREEYMGIFQTNNAKHAEEIATKDAKILELEKYKSMSGVKPVSELSIIMPEEVIKTIDEIVTNRSKAAESLADYLFTGKGQEEAVKQLNRAAITRKSFLDGTADIKMVKEKYDEAAKFGVYGLCNSTEMFALNMLRDALCFSKNGELLVSTSSYRKSPFEEQVLKNFKALIEPMKQYDKNGNPMEITDYNKRLTDILNNVRDFHLYYKDGVKQAKGLSSSRDIMDFEERLIPFNYNQSRFVTKNKTSGEIINEYPIDYVVGWGKTYQESHRL